MIDWRNRSRNRTWWHLIKINQWIKAKKKIETKNSSKPRTSITKLFFKMNSISFHVSFSTFSSHIIRLSLGFVNRCATNTYATPQLTHSYKIYAFVLVSHKINVVYVGSCTSSIFCRSFRYILYEFLCFFERIVVDEDEQCMTTSADDRERFHGANSFMTQWIMITWDSQSDDYTIIYDSLN